MSEEPNGTNQELSSGTNEPNSREPEAVPTAPIAQTWGPFEPERGSKGFKQGWLLLSDLLLASMFIVALLRWVPGVWFSPILFCMALVGVFWTRRDSNEPFARKEDWKLADGRFVGNEAIADVWVKSDKLLRGKDRGVLWTAGGNLCFKGHRSWFRIRRQDVQTVPSDPRRRLASQVILSASGELAAVQSSDPVQLIIYGWESSAHRRLPDWLMNLSVWPANRAKPVIAEFMDSTPTSETFSQLPPLVVDPFLKVDRNEKTDPYAVAISIVRTVVWFDAAMIAMQLRAGSPTGVMLLSDVCIVIVNVLALLYALSMVYRRHRSSRVQANAN